MNIEVPVVIDEEWLNKQQQRITQQTQDFWSPAFWKRLLRIGSVSVIWSCLELPRGTWSCLLLPTDAYVCLTWRLCIL
jgi:hypothetical protein